MAVKVTLNPKGRNVLLQKQHGTPHITKDGVSVTERNRIRRYIRGYGSQLVKEVSQRTVNMSVMVQPLPTVLAKV